MERRSLFEQSSKLQYGNANLFPTLLLAKLNPNQAVQTYSSVPYNAALIQHGSTKAAPAKNPIQGISCPNMALKKSMRTWCPSPLRNSCQADETVASRKALEFAKRRRQAVTFINQLTGAGLPLDASEVQFQESLRDGVILLQLLNKILLCSDEGEVKVVQVCGTPSDEAHAAIQAMGNISNFLGMVQAINPELRLFEAADFEEKVRIVWLAHADMSKGGCDCC